jgi:hypothetical protein
VKEYDKLEGKKDREKYMEQHMQKQQSFKKRIWVSNGMLCWTLCAGISSILEKHIQATFANAGYNTAAKDGVTREKASGFYEPAIAASLDPKGEEFQRHNLGNEEANVQEGVQQLVHKTATPKKQKLSSEPACVTPKKQKLSSQPASVTPLKLSSKLAKVKNYRMKVQPADSNCYWHCMHNEIDPHVAARARRPNGHPVTRVTLLYFVFC